MTNDAQDRHGQGEERLTPDAGRSDSRPPTTPNPTAGPDQSRSETSGTTWMSMDEDASEGRPPRGTPTPGHQNPVGRPDEGPAVHARRLGGTAPGPPTSAPLHPRAPAARRPPPVRSSRADPPRSLPRRVSPFGHRRRVSVRSHRPRSVRSTRSSPARRIGRSRSDRPGARSAHPRCRRVAAWPSPSPAWASA